MAEFDINKVKGNDRFIAGGAVVLIIVAFFPWRTVSYGPFHNSIKLFGTGSYGWPKLSFLLALIAGGIVVARLMGVLDSVQLPAGVNFITLAASGLGTAILLLQFAFGFHIAHVHPGWGYYIGIIISGAMTYFAFLNFKTSGEQMPSRPAGSSATPPPPPPSAYPPPPTAPPAPPSES